MGVTTAIYETLWGSSEVPENRTVSFLLSNFSYILFGILLLLKRTGDQYDEDRMTRAWIILLVGFVSTIFHANQVLHGHEDHRTNVFHKLDITVAILAFAFAILIRGIDNVPPITFILIVISAPFYLYNGRYYWLSHSIWHFISALILYTILDY
jgi:uncharacterized membrane protein